MLSKQSHLAAALAAGAWLLGVGMVPAYAQTKSQTKGQTKGQTTVQTTVSKQDTPSGFGSAVAADRQLIATNVEMAAGVAGASVEYRTLYVNPESGNDRAGGLAVTQPLKTVTQALAMASPNTVIVLAPGRYTQATGEVFPLRLKPGVTIQGTPGVRDRSAIIEGGGSFVSPARSRQNVAVLAADRAGIAQVAISNPDGYGVWVENASPTILETAFVGNRQTGLYVVDGSPRVERSYFSGNQVAGLIVLGFSSAHIHRNVFEETGDAIRVVEGATPEIVGNRMINNNAGLVLVGDASPILRNNQIVGNRRNEVVAVPANTREVPPSALLTNEAAAEVLQASVPQLEADAIPGLWPDAGAPGAALIALQSGTSSSPVSLQINPPAEPFAEPLADQFANEPVNPVPVPSRDRLASAVPFADLSEPAPLAETRAVRDNRSLEADAVSIPVRDAGAPGAALQALQSGLALAPRAVTEDNSDSPVLSPRLRRRRRSRPEPEAVPDEPIREQPTVDRPVNNNRLAVPDSAIPIGTGRSRTVFAPPGGGASIPSRAESLGLYYRVFVEVADAFAQDDVKTVVPDAFRTWFDGRTVMQVGAFPTEEEAENRRRLLDRNDFEVWVEYSGED